MVETVLCIDDDPVTQMLCKMHLKKAGICETVLEALNGKLGLDFYNNLKTNADSGKLPEVILLDLNMPIMGGWDFLEAFTNEYPEIAEQTKIFIHSSSVDPEDFNKAKHEKWITGYLAKPLDAAKLAYLKSKLG